jgi:hypothetical protein
MMKWRIQAMAVALLLLAATSPARGDDFGIAAFYNQWLGSDTSTLSESERDSLVCIASAVSVGALITLVGGTAIVIGGNVGAATGTAIALPVLVSSMWAACGIGRAAVPGVIWLQHRSRTLVHKLGGTPQ